MLAEIQQFAEYVVWGFIGLVVLAVLALCYEIRRAGRR